MQRHLERDRERPHYDPSPPDDQDPPSFEHDHNSDDNDHGSNHLSTQDCSDDASDSDSRPPSISDFDWETRNAPEGQETLVTPEYIETVHPQTEDGSSRGSR